ncbi:hypothetical protein QR680_007498 [Steinernema hermaphroditum]|uniref:Uncharacterized protein n=1 Tax=Steinernema hermaphroditum TaxID=289476 RepID=A0AA39M683_9BILA|nr:hypothetical protein QR680_007498 [Steinernema hermaphroditum]
MMPVTSEVPPASPVSVAPPRIRSVFPETWLWMDSSVQKNHCCGLVFYYQLAADGAGDAGPFPAPMQVAAMGGGGGGGAEIPTEPPRVRSNFVETWVWAGERVDK